MYTISETPIARMITFDQDQCIGNFIRNKTHFGLDQIIQAKQFIPTQNKEWQPFHFIDIGANIGTHIIAALLGVGFTEATAFEPVPELFEVLEENIRINGLIEKSALFNLALSKKRAILEIELSPINMGDNRIVKGNRLSKHNEAVWEKVKVFTVTLDSITSLKHDQLHFLPLNISRPDLKPEVCNFHLEDHNDSTLSLTKAFLNRDNTLVWIDTQGHEPDVLRGAGRLLKSKIPLVTEFWPYGLARAGFSFNTYWKFLKHRTVYILSDQPTLFARREALAFFNSAVKVENENYSPHLDLLVI